MKHGTSNLLQPNHTTTRLLSWKKVRSSWFLNIECPHSSYIHQRVFVPIYFKKMRRYHGSNLLSVIARVLPKQSPGTTQPAPPRIPPPQTNRHHLFKTLPWSSSNRNGIVPRIFLKCPQIQLSSGEAASSCRRPLQGQESLEYLVLIFPSPCPFTQPSTFDFRPSTI